MAVLAGAVGAGTAASGVAVLTAPRISLLDAAAGAAKLSLPVDRGAAGGVYELVKRLALPAR